MRDVARRHGLVTAEKPESQEICFVPGGDYRDALRERAGWQPTPGPLLDRDGRQVGEHAGAAAYTVGQRQGLGVALGEPRYVAASTPRPMSSSSAGGRTWPATPSSLRDVCFIAGGPPAGDAFECEVRIRHRAAPVPALVERLTAEQPGRRGTWLVGRGRASGPGSRPGRRLLRRRRGASAAGASRRRWRPRKRRCAPRDAASVPEIGPSLILAVIVGIMNVAIYVLIRGTARARLVFLVPAAILGAYAGQALGARLGDPLRIGDFGLISASIMAWIGIVIVVIIGTLVPSREGP